MDNGQVQIAKAGCYYPFVFSPIIYYSIGLILGPNVRLALKDQGIRDSNHIETKLRLYQLSNVYDFMDRTCDDKIIL